MAKNENNDDSMDSKIRASIMPGSLAGTNPHAWYHWYGDTVDTSHLEETRHHKKHAGFVPNQVIGKVSSRDGTSGFIGDFEQKRLSENDPFVVAVQTKGVLSDEEPNLYEQYKSMMADQSVISSELAKLMRERFGLVESRLIFNSRPNARRLAKITPELIAELDTIDFDSGVPDLKQIDHNKDRVSIKDLHFKPITDPVQLALLKAQMDAIEEQHRPMEEAMRKAREEGASPFEQWKAGIRSS